MSAWYHAGLHRAAHPRPAWTRRLPLALSAALLTACGAGASASYFPGASNAARGGGTGHRTAPAPKPEPPWGEFDAARQWPAEEDKPLVVPDHGGGRYVGTVRVSPGARKAYESLTRGSELPAGSIVAMFHEDARGHGAGPVYVMQKGKTGWRYLILEPDGRIHRQGAIPLCERCHAEATADHLFGLPAGASGD